MLTLSQDVMIAGNYCQLSAAELRSCLLPLFTRHQAGARKYFCFIAAICSDTNK